MTAPTTIAQAIQEINATNLVDGQQIKQLLADLSTFLATLAGTLQPQAGPAELTDSTGGTVGSTLQNVTGTFSQTILNSNFASLNAQLNNVLTKLVAAGVLTSV
jgi:hypothetical protein